MTLRNVGRFVTGLAGILLGLACAFISFKAQEMSLLAWPLAALGLAAGGYLVVYSFLWTIRSQNAKKGDVPEQARATRP